MLPVVVLVGRPNVGKSTFYNLLTRSRDALVSDFPGLTRDRQYGRVTVEDKSFYIVDTGGIGVEDEDIDTLMAGQSERALEEADLILFMVDARAGLAPLDETIALKLRKRNKPVVLIVNKIDGLNETIAPLDFQKLAIHEYFAISAANNRGTQAVMEKILQTFEGRFEDQEPEHDGVKIAFIGRPNVGKSTLLNRILGEERVVVYDMPGTTRDSISVPFTRNGKDYVLIDTAGVRRRARVSQVIEKFSIIKTLEAIRQSNVCLLLIDAQEGLTDQDLHLLGLIVKEGRALVIVVNKWDGLSDDARQHIKNELYRRLQFVRFAKIKFISALHGSGVGLLYDDIDQAYESSRLDLSTPRLTRILEELVADHALPMINGRRIKLRYAHAGGQNPPIIVVHGNQVDKMPDSYKRYLMNGFMTALKLVGTPLTIELKGNDNPYKDKHNTLTPRQEYKRSRMMKHYKKEKKSKRDKR